MKRLLRADKKPSRGLIRRIADYFLLPPTALTDSTPLPPYEELMIDEELLKIQKNDIDDKVVFFRNRHFIRKNYRVLGHGKRVKLVLSLIATLIPLLAYTGYCAGLVTKERSETLDKYRKGSDETEIYDTYSLTQVSYHDKLATNSKENDSNAFYCDVKVGSRLYLISNISYSTNSYITRMELYFKFDKDEFARMFKHYAEAVLDNLILDAYEKANPDQLKPSDVSISAWLSAHEPFVDGWVKEYAREYYPGETPSNVLTDKQTMLSATGDLLLTPTEPSRIWKKKNISMKTARFGSCAIRK